MVRRTALHRRRRRRAAGPMRLHAASQFEIDPPVYSDPLANAIQCARFARAARVSGCVDPRLLDGGEQRRVLVAGRGRSPAAIPVMLLIYAYGTNTGVRAVTAGDHGHSEDNLRYIRGRYFPSPPAAKWRVPSRTPPPPPTNPGCGAKAAPQWRRIRPTSLRSTRRSSPNGTRATGAANGAC